MSLAYPKTWAPFGRKNTETYAGLHPEKKFLVKVLCNSGVPDLEWIPNGVFIRLLTYKGVCILYRTFASWNLVSVAKTLCHCCKVFFGFELSAPIVLLLAVGWQLESPAVKTILLSSWISPINGFCHIDWNHRTGPISRNTNLTHTLIMMMLNIVCG